MYIHVISMFTYCNIQWNCTFCNVRKYDMQRLPKSEQTCFNICQHVPYMLDISISTSWAANISNMFPANLGSSTLRFVQQKKVENM